jgi:hypothetical protein
MMVLIMMIENDLFHIKKSQISYYKLLLEHKLYYYYYLFIYRCADSTTRCTITDTAQHQTQVNRPVNSIQMKQTQNKLKES